MKKPTKLIKALKAQAKRIENHGDPCCPMDREAVKLMKLAAARLERV